MTKEERKRYDAWYNRQGYKKKPNRKYYMRHRDEILKKAKARREMARAQAPI